MKRMQKKMWIQVNTIMYCFEYTLKVRNHVGVSASLIEPPQLPTAAVNAWNGQIRRNFVIGLRQWVNHRRLIQSDYGPSIVCGATEVQRRSQIDHFALARWISDLSDLNLRAWRWSVHPRRDLIISSYLELRDLQDSLSLKKSHGHHRRVRREPWNGLSPGGVSKSWKKF